MSTSISNMFNMIGRFAPAAVIATAASTCLGQTAAIERIAPENSVLVVGTRNAQTMMDHVKQTGLWAMLQSDSIKAKLDQAMNQAAEELKMLFEELGVEEGSLVPPTGPAGIALFPVTDDETGMIGPGMLLMADYGDDAAATKTDTLFKAILERGETEGDIEFEEEDFADATIYTIDLSKMQQKMAAEMDDEDMGIRGRPGMPPMGNPFEALSDFQKLHYVRIGNAVMLSSSLTPLHEALDAMNDRGGAEGVVERPEFAALMSKIGGDNDMYAVLLTRDVMDLIAPMDQMGMMQMMLPTVRAAFGKVDGYAVGTRAAGSTAMIEQTFAVYIPEGKKGFTSLFDLDIPRQPVPPFVTSDSLSYTSLNFEFSGLMPTLRDIVNSNPMLAAQAGQMMAPLEQAVTPLLNTLGTRVQFIKMASQPITSDSVRDVYAIECVKPQEFETAFAAMAAQGGFEPRDFLGHRIYTFDAAGMPMMPGMGGGMGGGEVSLGLGGGYLFLGPPTSVEQALRLTGQQDAPALTREDAFQRAVRALSGDPVVAWGWSDTVRGLEVTAAQLKAQQEQVLADMREFDPEYADEMEQEMAANPMMSMFDDLDFDMLRKHIGPSVWQLRAVEDGYVGRYFTLSPAPQE